MVYSVPALRGEEPAACAAERAGDQRVGECVRGGVRVLAGVGWALDNGSVPVRGRLGFHAARRDRGLRRALGGVGGPGPQALRRRLRHAGRGAGAAHGMGGAGHGAGGRKLRRKGPSPHSGPLGAGAFPERRPA
ncbi:hypothetical protein D7X94_08695 [Acutalibacter sp. 1XD8-33]|nr:hypothetical protein D7X94_08695 [Acutalibacter sp. 1XD8-33]